MTKTILPVGGPWPHLSGKIWVVKSTVLNTNRMASPDPIIPNPANPQSFNRYSYSYNNPVRYVDPDGHSPRDPICVVAPWACDPYWGAPGYVGHLSVTTNANDVATVVGFVPGVGGAVDVYDIGQALVDRNYAEAGIIALLSWLPGTSRVWREGGELAGSALKGANWPRIGEFLDSSVIRQIFPDSCSSACGKMLLSGYGVEATQEAIIDLAGRPTSVGSIAEALNRLDTGNGTWIGGGFANSAETVGQLNQKGAWMANMMVDGSSIQHSVIVDGYDEAGNLIIHDPWEATTYTMTMDDFLNKWGGFGVFYEQ